MIGKSRMWIDTDNIFRHSIYSRDWQCWVCSFPGIFDSCICLLIVHNVQILLGRQYMILKWQESFAVQAKYFTKLPHFHRVPVCAQQRAALILRPGRKALRHSVHLDRESAVANTGVSSISDLCYCSYKSIRYKILWSRRITTKTRLK